MARMYVRHQVADYAAWRQVYDAFDRDSLGARAHAVYQAVDDPNDVTVWHDFDTREAAEAFVASDELKAVMGEAGVQGAPTILITIEA